MVVVPEYNHGYPAALKFVIDSVQAHWQAKPVAFVAYGGHSGGIRAAEQLRQVFSGLHAVAGARWRVLHPGVGTASTPEAGRATATPANAPPAACWTSWPGTATRSARPRAAWPYPAG